MLFAQVVNGIILPVVLIAILKLINDKKLMGEYTNPTWLNAVAWLSSIAIIIVTVVMIGTTVMQMI
jgi:Mn2+/Fe2+ NRAMP family transporter